MKTLLILLFLVSCTQRIPHSALKQSISMDCRGAYDRHIYEAEQDFQQCQQKEMTGITQTILYTTGLKETKCSYNLVKAQSSKDQCQAFFKGPKKYKLGQKVNLNTVGLSEYSPDCTGVVRRFYWANGIVVDKPVAEVEIQCPSLSSLQRFEAFTF